MTKRPWLRPLVALVLVYGLFALLAPETFARPDNLTVMARQTAVVGIASVGMTLVILTGGIDLSTGSSIAFTTVVIALALRAGAGPLGAVTVGLAAAGLAGLVVGAIITRVRVTPFIVTLGAMTVLRGVAKGLAHEQKIDTDPRGLDALVASAPGSFVPPVSAFAMVALAALAIGLVHHTRFGRHVVAVGSSEPVARLAGVRVHLVKISVYAIAGLLSGFAGVIEFATLTVGDPTDSVGRELSVIAAVVIGGGSLLGGQASIAGSLVGALLMTVITTGCTHVGVPNWVQEIVTGIIIVAAVALEGLRRRG